MADRKSAAPASDANQAPSFEQALERLETIVSELEGAELSLEDSLARYEEGMRLSQRLSRTLDEAEKRIERLAKEGEPPGTEPFELDLDKPPRAPASGEGELPF